MVSHRAQAVVRLGVKLVLVGQREMGRKGKEREGTERKRGGWLPATCGEAKEANGSWKVFFEGSLGSRRCISLSALKQTICTCGGVSQQRVTPEMVVTEEELRLLMEAFSLEVDDAGLERTLVRAGLAYRKGTSPKRLFFDVVLFFPPIPTRD